MQFLFKGYYKIRFHFSLFSFDWNSFLSFQTLSSHSNLHFLQDFGLIKLQSSGKNSLSLSFHAFHTLDLSFWVFFENFGVFENFWDFYESFGLGVVYLMLYDHALHSISFFSMFHAFRCVFDCWILCAARFRLSWTHDVIIFSTSNVHAYIPFLFYLSVLSCDCFLSFSLSLSLSLSDTLRMAPKRKSTPTRNPFCSESSSSSDPPIPLRHVRFHDEKAHQVFSENFSNQHGIHPKRHVILSDFSDTPFLDVIHTWGWESLCEITLRCPIVFIQEFYSNMHGIDTSRP